ncbi:hypothetical protein ACFY9G_36285 [Streptomyces anthocyanicus]|uniref:hypothetical protein n=1 Tax=Streptomyces anthocyanicus TaxID=68174 RepID=UPI0036E12D27
MTATHITNARVFDGTHPLDATTLTLEGGTITAVGAPDAPRDAEVVDAKGGFLLPGTYTPRWTPCARRCASA